MKYCLLTITFFLSVFFSISAQEYKKFKVGLGGGIAGDAGVESYGKVFYVEPAYRITDNVLVGLKLEGVFYKDTGIEYINSQSLTAQYYFLDYEIRPFVGATVGRYSLAPQAYVSYESKISFAPRVGLDFGPFTLLFEFNRLDHVKQTIRSVYGTASVSYREFNYFSTKIGVAIGGGRKRVVK
jgi:hypothetical protein